MTVRVLAGKKILRCKEIRLVQSLVQSGDGGLEICCAMNDDASCVDIYVFLTAKVLRTWYNHANDRSTVVD